MKVASRCNAEKEKLQLEALALYLNYMLLGYDLWYIPYLRGIRFLGKSATSASQHQCSLLAALVLGLRIGFNA